MRWHECWQLALVVKTVLVNETARRWEARSDVPQTEKKKNHSYNRVLSLVDIKKVNEGVQDVVA